MNDILNEYFEWLCNIVSRGLFAEDVSYRKLLMQLHSTPFFFTIPNDKNRANDGTDLRFRFGLEEAGGDSREAEDIAVDLIDGLRDCTVLEMLIALSLRCEENIMDDAEIGDRTVFWFWRTISNLELNGMTDDQYDRDYVEKRLQTFLHRNYAPDGEGGLFYLPGIGTDLRRVEIWTQLLWYLDTIT